MQSELIVAEYEMQTRDYRFPPHSYPHVDSRRRSHHLLNPPQQYYDLIQGMPAARAAGAHNLKVLTSRFSFLISPVHSIFKSTCTQHTVRSLCIVVYLLPGRRELYSRLDFCSKSAFAAGWTKQLYANCSYEMQGHMWRAPCISGPGVRPSPRLCNLSDGLRGTH